MERLLNKITRGDCFDIMPELPDKSIDMILCDLPYGTTQNKWDSVLPLDKLWEQYKRIIKDNGAIVLTAQTPFDKVLGVSNLDMLRYEWIWDKKLSTGFLNAARMPLKRHENVLVFYKNLPVYNPIKTQGKPYTDKVRERKSDNYGDFKPRASTNETGMRLPTSIIEISNADRGGKSHPTEKPVELYEYFIKTYTNPGDIILDNCSGSGVLAEAALNLRRQYICIEITEKYFNSSIEREKRIKRRPKKMWFK